MGYVSHIFTSYGSGMEADAGSAAPNNKAIATYLCIYSSIRLVGIYWEKLVL